MNLFWRRKKRKIDYSYFDYDYWMVRGEKSGYSPGQGYTINDFQWEAIAQMLINVFGKVRFMEAGCAFGWIVHQLWLNGIDAHGFDISKYAINNAPPAVKHDRVYQSDGLSPHPFEDGYFDVIYTIETAEHVHHDDVPTWWENLSKALRPGGKVFATICTGHDNIRGSNDPDESHQTLQPREWWYKMLERYGLYRNTLLEDLLIHAEVKTERLDEPLCLAEYYDWNVFGMVKRQ